MLEIDGGSEGRLRRLSRSGFARQASLADAQLKQVGWMPVAVTEQKQGYGQLAREESMRSDSVQSQCD